MAAPIVAEIAKFLAPHDLERLSNSVPLVSNKVPGLNNSASPVAVPASAMTLANKIIQYGTPYLFRVIMLMIVAAQ